MIVIGFVILAAAGVQWFTRRQRNTMSQDVHKVAGLAGWGAVALLVVIVLAFALAAL